jgi:hypothetical protein
MKSLSSIIILFFLSMLFPVITKACEIIVSIDRTKKEIYKTGDVVVVKITVVLKHRNCDVDINETTIKVSGSQITGTTKWVNTKGRTWERKIKVKILGNQSNQSLIIAERICDRDGGKGSLLLATGN